MMYVLWLGGMFAPAFGCEGFFAHVWLPLVQQQQQQEWSRIFPSPRGELKKDFSIDKYYAGLSIKRGYKAYKLRKEVHSRIDEKEHIAQRPRRKSDASKLLCVLVANASLGCAVLSAHAVLVFNFCLSCQVKSV